MTHEELETALSKIGWRIEKSWNGLNDVIVNHKNEKTSFYVDESKIEIREHLFGGDSNLGRGSVHFEMKHITIHISDDMGLDNVITLHFSDYNFISFFNFSYLDKK